MVWGILSCLHGKQQIEDNGLSATNQKILYKSDDNNHQLWFNFNEEKSEYKITKTGITTTTSDKNKNEIKQIEFSALTDDMRPFIYAISKLQKDENAEKNVQIDIDVGEYQKLRGLKSRKETKKQILKQVSLLLNAWVTVQVDINAENNKKRSGTKESRDIRLIAAKDTRFNNGKLSLWFTPDVAKYLTECRMHVPPYYYTTKSIVESQLIYYIQNIQNTKKYHKENKQNPNEFLIGTKNLLKATNLPSYEKVMKSPTQCPRR
ncbi:MAG: hypothetical protein LE169_03815 [Endomicrobium sp.]|nr:hypothetical protein [Endomicrobium sp.]